MFHLPDAERAQPFFVFCVSLASIMPARLMFISTYRLRLHVCFIWHSSNISREKLLKVNVFFPSDTYRIIAPLRGATGRTITIPKN